MNKSAIQKFAIQARTDLIAQVKQQAFNYGIDEKGYGDKNSVSINGVILSADKVRQRKSLIEQIEKDGYEQVLEKVAYTWFNRFIALRFMEVNDYLPTHIRVFSNDKGEFKPEILNNVLALELKGLDKNKVSELLDNPEGTEDLYRYLLLTQCNALHDALPEMFEEMGGYTELLLPLKILSDESVIAHLVNDIDEADFKEAVEIIGWLYQYYNTELNEVVYDGTLSKKKIPKELLPAATTIFTPDWAVRYMVENSLGKLWLETNPNDELKIKWKYYLENTGESANKEKINLQDIKIIDPCMGSGHILVYVFDILADIYASAGYSTRDAVKSIVENNIYGLDISDRAYQIAYFAIMMKARQYDRRFFSRSISPKLYSIKESIKINRQHLKLFGLNLDPQEYMTACEQINYLIDSFMEVKEYGSVLKLNRCNWELLHKFVNDISIESQMTLENTGSEQTQQELIELINTGIALEQKYDVVITNPPYLGSSRFSAKLDKYVKDNYAEVKSDLSMVMFKHAIDDMCKKNGFVSFITTSTWMYISSFEKLRKHILNNYCFESIADFGTELFDGKVGHNPIVAWVNRKTSSNKNIIGIRLVDYCYARRNEKQAEYFNVKNRYIANQENFSKIPGSPIAYWVSENFIDNFSKYKISDNYFSGGRNKTHNNEKYLRIWWEIGNKVKWQPYDKGGDFRCWYGNHEWVVDWSDEAKNEYSSHGGLYNQSFLKKEGICWTLITSAKTAFRIKLSDHHYDSASPVIFNNEYKLDYSVLGFLNTKVSHLYLNLLNPTINMGNTYVLSLPLIIDNKNKRHTDQLVKKNISLSKNDWDAFETSWDFEKHPLLNGRTVQSAFKNWKNECDNRFNTLKSNEEELNRIFIDIYGLQDELTPEVEDKDVTLKTNTAYRYKQKKKKNNNEFEQEEEIVVSQQIRDKKFLHDTICEFISYAVGCMFGRYSLYNEGLLYAGDGSGDYSILVEKIQDHLKAKELSLFPEDEFYPDTDNIIPICDEEYFTGDIVNRFVEFVKVVYGTETLEENLNFIANALGNRGATSREVIRAYFLNDFYKDHVKTYSKRPIYWLFDSGKKNGFKALIYMHRYQPDLLARMRTDYVHEQQERYRTQLAQIEEEMIVASASDKVKLTKTHKKLQEQALEIQKYEEKIHHLADQNISIDLDDGVVKNYAIFSDVVAKIK